MGNNRIRKVNTAGIISTIWDDGQTDSEETARPPAINAEVNAPADVAAWTRPATVHRGHGNFQLSRKTPEAGVARRKQSEGLWRERFRSKEPRRLIPNTGSSSKGTTSPTTAPHLGRINDFVNNQMPTQLDGVSVTVHGRSAFVYYVSPTQVNILAPPEALVHSAEVQLKQRIGHQPMTVAAKRVPEYSPRSSSSMGCSKRPATIGMAASSAPRSYNPGLALRRGQT